MLVGVHRKRLERTGQLVLRRLVRVVLSEMRVAMGRVTWVLLRSSVAVLLGGVVADARGSEGLLGLAQPRSGLGFARRACIFHTPFGFVLLATIHLVLPLRVVFVFHTSVSTVAGTKR